MNLQIQKPYQHQSRNISFVCINFNSYVDFAHIMIFLGDNRVCTYKSRVPLKSSNLKMSRMRMIASNCRMPERNEESIEREMNRRKKEQEKEEMRAKLDWGPENCAQPIGETAKVTGEGDTKKYHFHTFKFRGEQYGLEDSVVLVPENRDDEPYIAMIKDIYKTVKDEYVKLEVQWFYRPGDLKKNLVRNLNSKCLFYSFHRDEEIPAESVKRKCTVNFIPENKQNQNLGEHRGFIVPNVYDHLKMKVMKFSHKGFDQHQKGEIDRLLGNTILPNQPCQRSPPPNYITIDDDDDDDVASVGSNVLS